jgi:hypothetical protein
MAYASTSPLSYLGTMAAGAMADGLGFSPATQRIAPLIQAAANSNSAKTSSARVATNADATTIDTLCNRDISGSGAFTGVVPEIYTSTVGTGIGVDRMKAHGNLMFGANPLQMAQTFFIADGFVGTSKRLAPTLKKLDDGVEFGKFPNVDSLVYPADGVFPNYLGSGYPDYQAVVTNGVSTLVTTASVANFQLLASDLVNLGSAFSISDIANFANPGQVVAALNNVDGLTASGLNVVLAAVGIDPSTIYNLGNSTYNVLMQEVLNAVNVSELVANTQILLNTNIANMTSLGDYTNFDKIFVNSKDIISFSTIEEFREKLQALELGGIETVAQLAAYINNVEPASLPTIGNNTDFVVTSYVDDMIAKFLGGTGPNGAITLSDMIGVLGGVGISTHATEYITVMNRLYTAGELTALQSRLDELTNGLNGSYTTVVDPGPPEIISISDPFDSSIHASYASFQANKIGHIEAACAALMSRRNVNSDIQLAIDAWNNLFKKINDEKDFQSRIDMNYAIRTNFADNAVSFIQGLRGTMDQYDKAAIINGMVDEAVRQGDVGGEYMRAYIKELENKQVADDYDIRWRAEFDE